MINTKNLTDEELLKIGDLLGYSPKVAKKMARRFLLGCEDKLVNWNYDENINFGDMHKIVTVFYILSNRA